MVIQRYGGYEAAIWYCLGGWTKVSYRFHEVQMGKVSMKFGKIRTKDFFTRLLQ